MAPGRRSAAASRCSRGEEGFTLIELLVVIVIIGILAGVALPAFLSQKSKANDGAAKEAVRTAQTAAETFATDHDGRYTGMNVAALQALEPSLKDKSTAELVVAEALGEGAGYLVETKVLADNHTFAIEHTPGGETVRSCAPANQGGCLEGGHW